MPNSFSTSQRAQNPTEFAQPGLSRSNGSHLSEGVEIWVFVLLWLVLPRCEPTNLGVFDQTGLHKFGWVWSSLIKGRVHQQVTKKSCYQPWFLYHHVFHHRKISKRELDMAGSMSEMKVAQPKAPVCKGGKARARHSCHAISFT